MADRCQGYPGHCDPPASLIAYAILAGIGAILFAGIGVFVFRSNSMFIYRAGMLILAGACGIGGLLSLLSIPEARDVCDRTGGGVCPSCGHKNKVTWTS